jgi:hypothetical protein
MAEQKVHMVDDTASEQSPRWWQGLRRRVLHHLWYVHQGKHLRLQLTPTQSYKVLETAAKPSVNRLHLRHVFAHGRRYFLRPTDDGGFKMRTTNKVAWYPKRRTTSATNLYGDFQRIDDNTTLLTLHSHMRLHYLVDVFLWPVFMASMLVFMTWGVPIISTLIIALFALSWWSHRFNAQLEAHEMVYFIEKALEDFAPTPPTLPSRQRGDVVIDVPADFSAEWDKFYNEKRE